MKILYMTNYLPIQNSAYSSAGLNITLDNIKKLSLNGAIIDVCAIVNIKELEKTSEKSNEDINELKIYEISKFKKIKNIFLNLKLPIFCSIRFDERVKEYLNKKSLEYDLVLIDYTQNLAYADFIKTKKIIIEHDVSFLSFQRKYLYERNILKKIFYYIEYKRLEKYEKNMLEKYDKIIVLNNKDKKLLTGVKGSIEVIQPYFNKIKIEKKEHKGINLFFFGAMNRAENEEAVIYFIEKIYPKLESKVNFIVLGANPSEKLIKYKTENIKITGFIREPKEYFEVMDIGIVPLIKGAGIKIKTLEMLYAGIPIVSSAVGMEGIEIKNKEDAFVYNTEEECIEYINILINSKELRDKFSINSKNFMKENYENKVDIIKIIEK